MIYPQPLKRCREDEEIFYLVNFIATIKLLLCHSLVLQQFYSAIVVIVCQIYEKLFMQPYMPKLKYLLYPLKIRFISSQQLYVQDFALNIVSFPNGMGSLFFNELPAHALQYRHFEEVTSFKLHAKR